MTAMNTENAFIGDLKRQFKNGGTVVRLIFVNVLIFLIIGVFTVFVELGSADETTSLYIGEIISKIFGLQPDPSDFVRHPWGIFTYMFTHYGILHLLFNMVFLYVAGRMFVQLLGEKRLLYTYIIGGIFGGLLEVIAHGLFPKLGLMNFPVVGASGSIMAIFVAVAFYRPQMQISIFGLFNLRLVVIALLYILADFLNLGKLDGTAHFAHLGGAIFGILSIQSLNSPGNVINRVEQFINWIKGLFSGANRKKMKIKKGGQRPHRAKTDEQFNVEKKTKQDQIDKILDKISKSGYESLSKKERDFLFNQSKK
ncbi:MAG: rhomboid family intramembrane serine protease [Crocinitomicaceae bacterium]|nr:rhomboid family intramembrane serine protease [Crocinitomicaceae bacterium]